MRRLLILAAVLPVSALVVAGCGSSNSSSGSKSASATTPAPTSRSATVDLRGPGQTNGEGLDQFGAEWYALGATGGKVEKRGS
jgi:hypothetical protein